MEILSNRIVIDENICNGKPIIQGTRISVHTILDFLSSGESIDEILKNYPKLTVEDIYACLKFASNLLDKNFIIKTVA